MAIFITQGRSTREYIKGGLAIEGDARHFARKTGVVAPKLGPILDAPLPRPVAPARLRGPVASVPKPEWPPRQGWPES
jgi:hypothetical protein